MNDLLGTDLVELHEKLNGFAKYHHDKGVQEVYDMIEKVIAGYNKGVDEPSDFHKGCIAGLEGILVGINKHVFYSKQ